jgi:hypothetical protein
MLFVLFLCSCILLFVVALAEFLNSGLAYWIMNGGCWAKMNLEVNKLIKIDLDPSIDLIHIIGF